MNRECPCILIVDDQPADAGIIKAAVEVCLSLLGYRDPDIHIAPGTTAAIAFLENNTPDLLITDLFMPVSPAEAIFSELALNIQCDEMEWPQGLTLLDHCKRKQYKFPRLATTFFWNYPGFARYTDIFRDRLDTEGSLPKDIFYMVAGLYRNVSMREVEEFPPCRILFQALFGLIRTPKDSLEKNVQQFHLRSLFAEASAWLLMYPHHVLDVRNGIVVEQSNANAKSKDLAGKGKLPATVQSGKTAVNGKYKPWEESEGISEHLTASPWMPSFVFLSGAALSSQGPGFYREVMNELAETDDWHVDVEMPNMMALAHEHNRGKESLNWGEKHLSVSYAFRDRGALGIEKFLMPHHRRPNDREWAQLLLTLGFFSYWCHLPDHRAVRTPLQIAEIIRTRAKRPFRGQKNDKIAAKLIVEDLDLLELQVTRAIRTEKHNDWWRFLARARSFSIVGSARQKGNDYGRWLNGSVRFRDPRA